MCLLERKKERTKERTNERKKDVTLVIKSDDKVQALMSLVILEAQVPSFTKGSRGTIIALIITHFNKP